MGIFSKLFNREIKDTVPEGEQPQQQVVNHSNEKFHMVIDDVFTITGRGTIVTGKVDSGEVHVGETVTLNESRNIEIIGIEQFRKTLDFAQAGDNCGILLKDVLRDEVHKGDYLAK